MPCAAVDEPVCSSVPSHREHPRSASPLSPPAAATSTARLRTCPLSLPFLNDVPLLLSEGKETLDIVDQVVADCRHRTKSSPIEPIKNHRPLCFSIRLALGGHCGGHRQAWPLTAWRFCVLKRCPARDLIPSLLQREWQASAVGWVLATQPHAASAGVHLQFFSITDQLIPHPTSVTSAARVLPQLHHAAHDPVRQGTTTSAAHCQVLYVLWPIIGRARSRFPTLSLLSFFDRKGKKIPFSIRKGKAVVAGGREQVVTVQSRETAQQSSGNTKKCRSLVWL